MIPFKISLKIVYFSKFPISFFRECSFVTKALNAERAGAVAVVITDNEISNDQMYIDMIDDNTDRTVEIPATFLLGRDG